MADNLCGPSNALKRLETHASRNASAHQDRFSTQARDPAQSFRSPVPGSSAGGDAAFASFQDSAPQFGLTHGLPPVGNAAMGLPDTTGRAMHPSHTHPSAAYSVPQAASPWSAEYAAASRSQALDGTPATVNTRPAELPYQGMPHQSLHRSHQLPFSSHMLANQMPGYSTGRLLQGPGRVAAPAAVAHTNDMAVPYSAEAMEAAFKQFDDPWGNATEVEKEMNDWMAVHGPAAMATKQDEQVIDDKLNALADRLEEQVTLSQGGLDAERLHDEQPAGGEADSDLRRTAEEIVLQIGNNSKFEASQFVQLMRRILHGDVALDETQSDFVDTRTNEPLSSAPRGGDLDDRAEESVHPPVSGIHTGARAAAETGQDRAH